MPRAHVIFTESLFNSFQFQCSAAEIDIDTIRDTIRAGLNSSLPDSDGPMEIPDEPYHYRNWPAEPALKVFRRYLDNIGDWNGSRHPLETSRQFGMKK
jgi:hypothetical protein